MTVEDKDRLKNLETRIWALELLLEAALGKLIADSGVFAAHAGDIHDVGDMSDAEVAASLAGSPITPDRLRSLSRHMEQTVKAARRQALVFPQQWRRARKPRAKSRAPMPASPVSARRANTDDSGAETE
ncbi:hypothetical protein FQ775_01180 [Nitratireductor mangrovi]|uniref:Uncharacterized protein n=1 Tax=Nitratireductor mangrovi TaxID=2599600 RepID=A0A5B8KU09_9HYPH|nr:hypothetical protein [Nitratireductor mangrovi]QDY99094.1 hypothetical protein FQ775_01180 [Nitratireductor mangrovi]